MSAASHIATETQKRAQAFAHLDEARLGWFHLRAVVVAGVGFFADAYDIFVIGQALPMVYQVYYGPQYISGSYPVGMSGINNTVKIDKTPQNTKVDFAGKYPDGANMDAWLKASTNWGNFVGQLGFGYLGDKLGRKKMYGVELIIMIVCTIGSALVAPMANGFSILVLLSIWRFFLGIGIGGDYPMSATITSEFANVRYRGMMLSAVFAMQGIGIMIGGVVYIITLSAMHDRIATDYTQLDIVWRIALGAGVIPAIGALYFRLTIPETPRFTVDVIGDTDKAQSDVEKVLALNNVQSVASSWNQDEVATAKVAVRQGDFMTYFSQWKNFKVLLGCAYCWFALDVAWYGLSLNQSTVLNLIQFNGPPKVTAPGVTGSIAQPYNVADLFYNIAVGNLIIAFCGTVPGYWFTVAFIEKFGRLPIQYFGFAVITACLVVLAVMWDTISKQQTNFLIVFTIAQFFFQFGPNTTTFVIPGEVFPTRFRSTGHGISAAMGKVGAIVGIQVVGPNFSGNNIPTVLYAFAGVMATGFFATYLCPEPKGKTLEELSNEDEVIIA
ncbi:MFS general substrate transporter [Rhizoclosmatium globosum]|uniref:MFS general substrate transporter n=1 Tax=Rhizoclosmatium globosum TaxID=329046 RepID=A0A1Y2BVG1_9FUNG|nr:MFS general substrate transporter [Rhizoclosmatium globosum]|eukprot:ORY38749.1 MFS general substrate transporter [Rhizoclosmatium globosum]